MQLKLWYNQTRTILAAWCLLLAIATHEVENQSYTTGDINFIQY